MQAFGRDSQSEAPTAFVGNLAKETVQGDLDELFKGLKLEQVRIIHDKETGESKGYGYVTFRDQESLDEALKLTGTNLNGQAIRVDVKKPRQDRPRGGGFQQRGGYQGGGYQGGGGGYAPRGGNDFGGGAFGSRQQRYNDFGGDRQGGGGGYQQGGGGGAHHDRSVRPVPDVPPFVAYVGNLPDQCQESDISTMFEGLSLVKVHLVVDRETGAHRGFGFAEFKDKASLQNALTLDAAEWMGKQLKVRVHERREQRTPYGGGGGEGGGDQPARSSGGFDQPRSYDRGGRFDQPRGGGGGFDRFPRGGGGAQGEFRERRPPREEPEPINDGKERPKLVLQKKTEGAPAAATEAAKPASSSSKPSPFGNARPVDTATKLLQKEEEKRKADKAAADKAAAEAPAKAPEATQAE